jgi:hypothetical protein
MKSIEKDRKNDEKTVAEFKKIIAEKDKQIEKLEKELNVAVKLAKKKGIKRDVLEKLGIKQESNKSEELNKKRDFAVKPIHPGEILREELLFPRNISPEELAQEIKVPKEIVK